MQTGIGRGGFPASGGDDLSLEQQIMAALALGQASSKIEALRMVRSPEIREEAQLAMLHRALHDVDPEVNVMAAQILAEYGSRAKGLKTALVLMLGDQEYPVALAAYNALEAIR